MFLLLVFVGTALGGSFLCSLLEATLLSTSVVKLEERRARGDSGAKLLLKLKQERIDDAISAILILNTIAHTVGAAGAGAQAEEVFGSTYVGLFVVVLTLAILLFTEIVPKTLGTVHATRLVGFVARTTYLLIWPLRPLLFLTRLVTGFLSSGEKRPISRGEVAAMVAMATRQGTLHATSSRAVANMLRYPEIQVEDVMTPRTVVAMLPATATIAELMSDEHCRAFSRIPLYEETPDHVLGYVLQRDALAAAADGRESSTELREFLRKATYLPEDLPLDQALQQLIEGREHIAVVTDEYGGLSGLITLEDLLETILGVEILDESDRVADLRAEAVRLRDQRLRNLEPATASGMTHQD